MKYKLTPLGQLVIISFCLTLVFLIFITVNSLIKNNDNTDIKDTAGTQQSKDNSDPIKDNTTNNDASSSSKDANNSSGETEKASDADAATSVDPSIIEVTNSKGLISNIKLSVYFGANISVLEEHYCQALDLFAQTALTLDGSPIQIEGNCSTTLDPNDADNNALNYELSLSRAKAVSDYLQQKGIDPNRILVIGNGSSNPVRDNSTAANRKYNRRVDIFFRSIED